MQHWSCNRLQLVCLAIVPRVCLFVRVYHGVLTTESPESIEHSMARCCAQSLSGWCDCLGVSSQVTIPLSLWYCSPKRFRSGFFHSSDRRRAVPVSWFVMSTIFRSRATQTRHQAIHCMVYVLWHGCHILEPASISLRSYVYFDTIHERPWSRNVLLYSDHFHPHHRHWVDELKKVQSNLSCTIRYHVRFLYVVNGWESQG